MDPRLERFIGVIYRPESERWSHYSHAILPRQFDAWVWFDESACRLRRFRASSGRAGRGLREEEDLSVRAFIYGACSDPSQGTG